MERDGDPSPPSSADGHERVELYLYSPYGPYGLYRASVPVQGCSLLLLGYKPVQHVTVLNTVGNCNTMVSIIILCASCWLFS